MATFIPVTHNKIMPSGVEGRPWSSDPITIEVDTAPFTYSSIVQTAGLPLAATPQVVGTKVYFRFTTPSGIWLNPGTNTFAFDVEDTNSNTYSFSFTVLAATATWEVLGVEVNGSTPGNNRFAAYPIEGGSHIAGSLIVTVPANTTIRLKNVTGLPMGMASINMSNSAAVTINKIA